MGREESGIRYFSRESDERPVKFVSGECDNEAGKNVIESLTLSCDFFELVQ